MHGRLAALVVVVMAAATACTDSGRGSEATPESSSEPTGGPSSSEPAQQPGGPGHDLTPHVVADGLDVPWGIAFLPDGSALIAERDVADVQLLDPSGDIRSIGTVNGVVPTSEGGLLGLAVSPSYADDHMVYAYLTTQDDNRVVTMTYDGNQLSEAEPILTGIPRGEIHDGGRIAFGPDGKLYVTTGETGNGELAQDPDSLGGKILRLNPDGSIPSDNPDPGSPVWTLGHRNVQGITWDDEDHLFASEFGDSTWDELNLIEPGNNYGWPEAEGSSDNPDFTDPLRQWSTDDLSPSGIAYFDGSLYIAGLRGERLYRVPVQDDGTVGSPQALYEGEYGRLRTVVATPQGTLWFTTSEQDGRSSDPTPPPDRIFEIRP
jgi:glucose/arabinose dehydrogenase